MAENPTIGIDYCFLLVYFSFFCYPEFVYARVYRDYYYSFYLQWTILNQREFYFYYGMEPQEESFFQI
jgi:hypothetical protein